MMDVMLKTQLSSPGDRECFRLYNMLKEQTSSFSTLNIDTSQKANIITVQQASSSLVKAVVVLQKCEHVQRVTSLVKCGSKLSHS